MASPRPTRFLLDSHTCTPPTQIGRTHAPRRRTESLQPCTRLASSSIGSSKCVRSTSHNFDIELATVTQAHLHTRLLIPIILILDQNHDSLPQKAGYPQSCLVSEEGTLASSCLPTYFIILRRSPIALHFISHSLFLPRARTKSMARCMTPVTRWSRTRAHCGTTYMRGCTTGRRGTTFAWHSAPVCRDSTVTGDTTDT